MPCDQVKHLCVPGLRSEADLHQERKRLNEADSYGDGKLQCEEVLQAHAGFPHVSLRLPDVFGPYDNTNRHWKYQLWLAGPCRSRWLGLIACGAACHLSPVFISSSASSKKLSFVYRDDVTNAALAAIKLGPAVHGKAFSAPALFHS